MQTEKSKYIDLTFKRLECEVWIITRMTLSLEYVDADDPFPYGFVPPTLARSSAGKGTKREGGGGEGRWCTEGRGSVTWQILVARRRPCCGGGGGSGGVEVVLLLVVVVVVVVAVTTVIVIVVVVINTRRRRC